MKGLLLRITKYGLPENEESIAGDAEAGRIENARLLMQTLLDIIGSRDEGEIVVLALNGIWEMLQLPKIEEKRDAQVQGRKSLERMHLERRLKQLYSESIKSRMEEWIGVNGLKVQ